jgi:hypothetical protein
MMKMIRTIAIVIAAVLFFCSPQSEGQSPLPASDIRLISEAIQRDFGSIHEIRTVEMSDDPGGRFDIIVVGSRLRNDGWRVEVFSVLQHRITTKWDSAVMAREAEFGSSGPKSVKIRIREYDYDVSIQGCVPHLCSDGINGFLIFSGQSGETSKAKVVTQGLDKPDVGAPKYDVTFSQNISSNSRSSLEEAICSSKSMSNKSGLPLECKAP